MKVSELHSYTKAQVPYDSYVINMFHSETPDNSVAVLLGSAGTNDRNIAMVQFQFIIRSADPYTAESIAFQIYNHFNMKTKYVIGTTKIVSSRGQQSVPLYTGMDEMQRHIYSVNVEAMIDNN